MAYDGFVVGLARREHDLAGVDDDHVIAGVEVGHEGGLVLASQQPGRFGAQAAEHQAVGVDHVPGTVDLTRFGGIRAHLEPFLPASATGEATGGGAG